MNQMANYANQKNIEMIDLDKIKHKENDKHNRFIQPLDFKYEAIAMQRLNGNAFKLWRYLLRWYGPNEKYGGRPIHDFSPAALSKELGFGKNGGNVAFHELEKLGYIYLKEGKDKSYYFTPVLPCDYEILKNRNDF